MAIAGIQSGQDVYITPFAQQSSKQLSEPPIGRTTESDTVQISEKAMGLAQKHQAEKAQEKIDIGQPGAAIPDKDLPLEAFSIPGWMGDLTPKHAKADTRLGQPYLESNGALRDALGPSEKDDLSEYMHTLHTFYMEESESRGIETREDYYNSIVLNKEPGLSEELRQAVLQRLAEDPRMTALMQEFGVTA